MKAFWKKKKNRSSSKQPSNKNIKKYPEQVLKLNKSSPVVKKVEQPSASFGRKEKEDSE